MIDDHTSGVVSTHTNTHKHTQAQHTVGLVQCANKPTDWYPPTTTHDAILSRYYYYTDVTLPPPMSSVSHNAETWTRVVSRKCKGEKLTRIVSRKCKGE